MPRHILGLALALSCSLVAPTVAHASFDSDCDTVWDEMDTYPCDPKISGTAFAPAQGDHGMLMFEDLWPWVGDFDFNDVVVTYNYIYSLDKYGNVLQMRMTLNTLALGADYNNGLAIHLPVPRGDIESIHRTLAGNTSALTLSSADSEATFVVSQNLREVFPNPNQRINTEPNLPRQVGDVIEINIIFRNPTPMSVAGAPYDVFIFRTDNPSHEVHMPEYRGSANMDTTLFNTSSDHSNGGRNFVDARGIPFGLRFPTLTQYALEGVSIDLLYPNIVQFGLSGGTQAKDFYVQPIQTQYAYRDVAGLPAPAPVFLGPDHIPADTSCVPAWGIAVEWGSRRAIFTYGAKLADNGDALVTGYTRGDFPAGPNRGGLDAFVSRYDTVTGNEIWATQIGTAGDDTGRDLVTDAAGNIYVTGAKSNAASWGPWQHGQLAGLSDGFVAKLSPNGAILWEVDISGPGNDSGFGVEVDSLGNVYVAGYASDTLPGAMDPGGFPSSFLAKYSPNGTLLWLKQYRADPAHPSNYSYSMDVGIDEAAGVVWVVGTERRYNLTAAAAANPYVAKHNMSNGALLHVEHIGGHGYWNGSADGRLGYGINLSVDDFDGSVYITGSWLTGTHVNSWGNWVKPFADDSPDAYLVKLGPDGTELWNHILASNNRGEEFAEAVLSTGVGGNVYFTGRTNGSLPGYANLGGTDYYMASFKHDGTMNWVSQDGTAARDIGHLAASRVLSQQGGHVYVIGNSDLSFGQSWEAYWNTAFYQHDKVSGVKQNVVLARQLGWTTGPWSACSNTCGGGLMTRQVQCTWSDGTPAADPALCVRNPPQTESTCYDDSGCSVAWQIPAWSACTNTCGLGTRNRRVHCRDSNGFWRPDSDCAHLPRPISDEGCGDYSTCTYGWTTSTWSACSQANSCVLGKQSRSVSCMRSDGTAVADTLCAGTRPASSQACGSTTGCGATASSCKALRASGTTASGRYNIDVDGSGPQAPFSAYCDMSTAGGGWTNLDFTNNRIWLDAVNYIACGALQQDMSSVTCSRPRFNGLEAEPLYMYACDGSDRSVDYIIKELAPSLGHANSDLLGFVNQYSNSGMGMSTTDTNGVQLEYCYVGGQIVRWDDPACTTYHPGSGNGSCIVGIFTLGL